MTTAIDWDYLEKKTAELAEKSEGEERDALLVEMIGRLYPEDFFISDSTTALPPFVKSVLTRFKKLRTKESVGYDGYDMLGCIPLALYDLIPQYDPSKGVTLKNYLTEQCAWRLNSGYRDDRIKNAEVFDPGDSIDYSSKTQQSNEVFNKHHQEIRDAVRAAVLRTFPEEYFSERDRALVELLIVNIYTDGRYNRHFLKRYYRNNSVQDALPPVDMLIPEVLNTIGTENDRNKDVHDLLNGLGKELASEEEAGTDRAYTAVYIRSCLSRIRRRRERLNERLS
ncbi:MAG: hypothetical protein J5829_03645 [Lachnospiraceae bacterium]|nr:hypothetical protein [Lachnospiraceae bacterium]